ncbi:MAG: hypothetical protein WBA54_13035 [Acidaminobacteraceae bacterium]
MIYAVIGILVLLIIATVFVVKMIMDSSEEDDIDVVEEYSRLKTALLNFRKSGSKKCNSIADLKEFVERPDDISWDRYNITIDEKFLVVKNAKLLETDVILKKIGGTSYSSAGKLYLSFLSLSKISSVDVIAKFKIIPPDEIYTTTTVEYDTSGCMAEDDEINEYKWEGNESRFDEPGVHLIRLKVKDKNGNWSEWYDKELEVKERKGLKSIVSGFDSTYVIHNSGKVDIYGNNENGELGTGNIDPVSERQIGVNYSNVDMISAGEHHIVIKTYDGRVLSLGKNNYGQLGIASRADSKIPKEVWGLESIKMVAAGKAFSGALTTGGRVYTWGDNSFGQLACENSSYREIPKMLEDVENVKQISFGFNHALALTFDGRVIAWGGNDYGQLGVGYKGRTLEPTITEFKSAKYVCAGKFVSYVITEDGRVAVAGQNNKSQLGIPAEKEILFPKEILTIKGVIKIEASNCGAFAVVMDEIGSVYTWGQYNSINDIFHEQPFKVPGVKYIKDISASSFESYIISEKDDVFKWGYEITNAEQLNLEL